MKLTLMLQRGFRRLKNTKVSTATGGSTTTIADTALAEYLNDSNEDDIINGGSVVLVKDAGGAGAAPEGEFKVISDYTAATGTITLNSAMTAAVAAGDTYMYISKDFPLMDMIDVANDALVYLGPVPYVNTTLTTVALQTEYDLSLSMKGQQLLNVEIQGNTTDADDNQWIPLIPNVEWKVTPAAEGVVGSLKIPQFDAGRTLRITYLGTHTKIFEFNDYVHEAIHPDVAVAAFVAHAWQWRNHNSMSSDPVSQNMEDRAWNQLDIAIMKNRIQIPMRQIGGAPHWSKQ